MFGSVFLTTSAVADQTKAEAAAKVKAEAEAKAKADAEAKAKAKAEKEDKIKTEKEAKAKAKAEKKAKVKADAEEKKRGKSKAQQKAEAAQKAAEEQLEREKALFELEKARFKQAQEVAAKRAKELEEEWEELEGGLEEAEEKIHHLENIPWHRVRAQQKKAAKERAQARKEAKAAQERQKRIDRGLPVPPLPTAEEIEAQKAAKAALSEKLKGRTKRTAVEQLLGTGGLQAYNEETMTNQAGQPIPNDYDWTWRQKQFREEERATDRIDRMIGRMVDEDDDKIQEQLKLDRKRYAAEQKKHLLRTGGKARPSAKNAFAKSTHVIGSGKPNSSGKRTRFADTVVVNEFSKSAPVTYRQRRSNTRALASDIALFLDNEDDPAGLFRGLSGYFDDEVIDTDEIIDLVVDEIPEDGASGDSNDSLDDMAVIRPGDFLNEEELEDDSTDEEFDGDYDLTEALDPADAATLDDYYAIEWLNNILEDAVDDIFLKASDRVDPSGTADGIEFDLLRKQVIHEIQQEFATRLWLEDDAVSTKPHSIDLVPFVKEFGPSFGKVLESATRKSAVMFAKMATARSGARKRLRKNLDKIGRRPGVDVSGRLDLFNDNDAADSSGSETEPESPTGSVSSSSESSSSDSSSEAPDPKDQESLLEATLKAIQTALNNGGDDEDEPFDEDALRKAYGPDWRRRFTDTFRESIGQKGAKKTKGSKGSKSTKGTKKGKSSGKGGAQKTTKVESDEESDENEASSEESSVEDSSEEESSEEESSEEEEKKSKTGKSTKKGTPGPKMATKEEEKSDEDESSDESSEESSEEKSSEGEEGEEEEEGGEEEESSEEESSEEEEEEEEEGKENNGFRNVQLVQNHGLKTSNRIRSDAPDFPRVRLGKDGEAVGTVQEEMDRDSGKVLEDADQKERDWSTEYARATRDTYGHHDLTGGLLQGDRNFDYDKRTNTAPDRYCEEPTKYNPLDINSQDTHVIGHSGPLDREHYDDDELEDNSEDEREEDDYDGAEVSDAQETDSSEEDEEEEEDEDEDDEEESGQPVTAKRARVYEPPGHYTLVKKRRVSVSDVIDNAARLSAEVAALEASIWDPTILPKYRPSNISLVELVHWHVRVSEAFKKLSFGADDSGGFWTRERKKILDIGAALSYREALESGGAGEDFSQEVEDTDMEDDLESAVAAQLEGQHEYRLGTEVQGLGVPRPVMSAAQRALESVRPNRNAKMRDVARRFSAGKWS